MTKPQQNFKVLLHRTLSTKLYIITFYDNFNIGFIVPVKPIFITLIKNNIQNCLVSDSPKR